MSTKIIRLTVQNLLRIKAAEITPDGALSIVAGRNDQGKSSLLNCIGIALSGKNLPEEPIRKGASSGQVILETDQFVITRKFSQTGGGQLIVKDKDGATVTSPQTKLDALYNLTTFDPLTFTRQDRNAQAATLRKLTGLDFTAIDQQIQATYNERTIAGREVNNQRARVASIPRSEGPTEPIDVDALVEEMARAVSHNGQIERDGDLLSDLNDRVDAAQMAVERAKKELEAATKARDHHKATSREMGEPIDLQAIRARIDAATASNAGIKERARYEEERKTLTTLESRHAQLEQRIAELRQQKETLTANAKFPIEGLSFSEDGGVLFEGIPFAQISSSKQIRVSLAIACALNPNLRVMLIRDGSLLDADSLALVRDYAEKHDAQVFMECVGDREDADVIIEDGQVAATPKKNRTK